MTQSELAIKLGITKQNLNNKINRDNFTSKEICKIANVLEFDLVLKTLDTEHKINYK